MAPGLAVSKGSSNYLWDGIGAGGGQFKSGERVANMTGTIDQTL